MKYAWLILAVTPLIAFADAHPELVSGRLIRLHYGDVAQVRELAALGADICAHRRGFVEVMVPQQAELEREQPFPGGHHLALAAASEADRERDHGDRDQP